MNKKRTKMIILRIEHDLSQRAAARILECTPQYLSQVESCKTKGSLKFWQNFQNYYGIEDKDMWSYQKEGN